ncbi:MAG: pyridoxamine 5'-phosphate oxidase family protein [bacterium]
MGPAESTRPPQLFQSLAADKAPAWAAPLMDCIMAEADDPASRYATLATVDNLGRPHARYVVVRGAMGFFPADFIVENRIKCSDLWLVTDARSCKAKELQANNASELCWYFRRLRVQFRFSGITQIYGGLECPIRNQAWNAISEAARVQFYWPEPKATRDPFHEFEFTVSEPANRPPATFLVVQLVVEQVDRLSLSGNPQNRYIHQLPEDQQEFIREVNP